MRYDVDGSLIDATDHRWYRTRDWLEPAEAAALVEQGSTFLVEYCGAHPRREQRERYRRDIAPRLLTSDQLAALDRRSAMLTVMNPELWSGAGIEPTVVLFFESGPGPRGKEELNNDWE